MEQAAKFALNPESQILTPEAAGVAEIIRCLNGGKSIIASQLTDPPIFGDSSPDQWLFCETSGTSGNAKKIRRRPATWIKSFEFSAAEFAISQHDTYAVFGSLGHSLSLFATLEALHLGADLSVLSNLNPKRQIGAMLNDKTTVLYATPTQLKLLLRAAQITKVTSITSVRHLFIGGGTLSQSIKDSVCVLFPNADTREFFGATETSFITLSDAATPAGSVGRAYADVRLRIGDGSADDQGNVGEIWVKSDYLFDGYANDAPSGAAWDRGYLSIGEMGYLDHDGHLFLKGRKSRMVTISDINVFPEEIEQLLETLPEVQCCAVITTPDKERGHITVCIIQPLGSNLEPSTIRKHCRAKLGPHAVPKMVHFLPEMPRLAAGKPDLVNLQARYGNQS